MTKSRQLSNTVNITYGPAFAAFGSVATSLTSGANTKVNFQSESFDTNSCFASSRFTPTTNGYYQINARVQFNGSPKDPTIYVFRNGTESLFGNYIPGTFGFPVITVSGLVYLNGSTDYVEIYAYHDTGTAVNTKVDVASTTRFDGVLVRAA